MVLGGLCACGGDYYAPVESRRAPAEHHVKRGDTLHSIAFEYGLSYQEISEALEVPLGTVKSRIHNALARLSRDLQPEGGTR